MTWPRRMLLAVGWLLVLAATAVLGAGFVLDPPMPAPQPAQAIVVISGDEQMARFREGVRLFEAGYGKYLLFSGAARDLSGPSNADVMRDMAIQAGVPASAILEDPASEDTWGNAVDTRQVMQQKGLTSALLVTSPYHVQRARMTFDAAYAGSGINLQVHAAPDSEWRKLTWWIQPETRELTLTELLKIGYIHATGKYD